MLPEVFAILGICGLMIVVFLVGKYTERHHNRKYHMDAISKEMLGDKERHIKDLRKEQRQLLERNSVLKSRAEEYLARIRDARAVLNLYDEDIPELEVVK